MPSQADDLRVVKRRVFRELNERLSSFNTALSDLLPNAAVACECGNAGCTELLEVPLETYDAVRRTPRRFIVAAGFEHLRAGRERLVQQDAKYWIVETLASVAPKQR